MSPSVSVSPSISPSVSPSLSPEWLGYSRGSEVGLPADDTELGTAYTEQNYTDVETKNNVRVAQTSEGDYAIHQFKVYVDASAVTVDLECEVQTNYSPTLETVYLQIYNYNSTTWETVDSNNSADEDTDFILSGTIESLTNYRSGSFVVTCRVHQKMT